MTSKSTGFLILVQIFAITIHPIDAFPTPAVTGDKTENSRQLNEERPLQEQIAEADSVRKAETTEKRPLKEPETDPDFSLPKSLTGGSNESPSAGSLDLQYFTQDADSTKDRRLAEDYDSTKSTMDNKYQDDSGSFQDLDGNPLTAEDIVQKIAMKIYEEDDRGVFDRIVSKLLKLGLITDSQAETLEYEVAEALQELITKNAKNNEIEDLGMDYPISRTEDIKQSPDVNMEIAEKPGREAAQDGDETVENTWAPPRDAENQNELSPEDGLEDLQYFPNFYNLLKSLNSEKDAEERETLITIMKTLIDFVKMMVKYGTITPEEGVSYLENLDAMIALQTKNKLGKSLVTANLKPPTEKTDETDNTKQEAAKMQKEYESLKDSTKDDQAATESGHSGKSEIYLEAIRKNIEWLKNHNKDSRKEDYDLSKLRDFMDKQVDTYIDKGILEKEEGEVIKRIYGSM